MFNSATGQTSPYWKRRSRLLWTFALVLLLVVANWFIAVQREQRRTVTFTIPSGTGAESVTVEFPDEIVLTVGVKDTIVIQNEADDLHLFGPFVVAPHSTVTKRFTTPIEYRGACTFHPSQQMTLVVNPAPWDFWTNDE